ncbi:MAG: dehydrogenase [Salibacteraceae bacterium]
MIVRSKAPLRIGFAGGGTDVSPYSDQYGGAILNATINLFAYATIEPANDGMVTFHAADKGLTVTHRATEQLPVNGKLDLQIGAYNRIVREFAGEPLSFKMTTFIDAPSGSGLGTSSTLMVSILGAFAEWLSLPLGEYDIAHLAYEIERLELGMLGGKQDQYSATFGGFNFIEFFADDKVIVNPLRIRSNYSNELAHNLVLFYTRSSRESSHIIERQRDNVQAKDQSAIEAMHKLKEQSMMMKEALLRGEIDRMGEILHFGWENKKKMADGITNEMIDGFYNAAMRAGATGGKISGAGGGGFMIFYCPGNTRHRVIRALVELGGIVQPFQFSKEGLLTWKA